MGTCPRGVEIVNVFPGWKILEIAWYMRTEVLKRAGMKYVIVLKLALSG